MDAKDVVDVLVEQNKDFKDMLQWSIGSILGILVLFLAANFLTMRKMRKDEIEKIQSEVKAEVASAVREQLLPEMERELKDRLEADFNDKIRSLELKIDQANTKLGYLEREQNSTANDIKDDIINLDGDIDYLKADFYFNRGVHSNAFRYYLEAGKKYVKTGNKGLIPSLLNRLEESAKKLTYIDSDLPAFTEFAGTLEAKHLHQADKVIEILKTKNSLTGTLNG